MIPCLPFIRNERQGLVYDFMINGLKIQEKVSSKRKNDNGTKFNLDKSNGMNCGKQKQISYRKGDNDFYWLNLNNKQHFYIIPEHELISRNYINIDKLSCISLNPISKRKSKTDWAKHYLFDYTKLTKLDEEKLKIMFQIQ